MPSRIVTTAYRYKRPPRKKKPVLLEVPVIVTKRTATPSKVAPPPANDDRKSAIVTARRPGARSSVDLPDLTLEEHQRRGDAADGHCHDNQVWPRPRRPARLAA
jgi:hypothetical protein